MTKLFCDRCGVETEICGPVGFFGPSYRWGGTLCGVCWDALQEWVKPTKQTWCDWIEDDEGAWATQCGEQFALEWEGPKEHLHFFCPNCGNRIKEVAYSKSETD